VANVEYWLSPALIESYDFVTLFKTSLDAFGTEKTFTPRYKFKNLKGKMPEEFLRTNCYAKGEFCATENENFEPQSVLMEGIRQICIWDISKVSGGANNELWWSYIYHYRNCLRRKLHSKMPSGKHCYDAIREELNMNDSIHNQIQACLHASFTLETKPYESDNRVLESNINNKEYSDVYLVPAIFVNGNLVKEDLKPKVVISAMCNVLREKPEICQSYMFSNINLDYQRRMNDDSKGSLFAILFVVIIVAIGLTWYFKRSASLNIREEISDHVKTHVTEYIKLSDKR
jgi:hypothetical protein